MSTHNIRNIGPDAPQLPFVSLRVPIYRDEAILVVAGQEIAALRIRSVHNEGGRHTPLHEAEASPLHLLVGDR
ncbi:MAG: hypothetical protein R6U93_09325 [Dehalococcoidia bacterium]